MKHQEYIFQVEVVKRLSKAGIPCFSVPNHLLKNGVAEGKREISAGLRKGAPDLIAGINGKSLWLELKTDTGHQSPEQKAFQQISGKFGATYVVLRSLEQLEGIINNANHNLETTPTTISGCNITKTEN